MDGDGLRRGEEGLHVQRSGMMAAQFGRTTQQTVVNRYWSCLAVPLAGVYPLTCQCVLGLCGKVLVVGGAIGVASVRSC